METRRPPWWLWPNLLSLDAPLVAVAWLWMMIKAWRVQYFPPALVIALAGAVWCVYVADRLLDTKFRERKNWSFRHEFHAKHKKKMIYSWVIVALVTIVAALSELNIVLIGYLIPALIMCAVYFSMAIFSTESSVVSYRKNAIAGFCFAYGTAMCAHVKLYSIPFIDLLTSLEMLLFAFVCIVNMVAVDLWEAVDRGEEEGLFAELSLTPALGLLGAGAMLGFLKSKEVEDSIGGLSSEYFFTDEYYLAVLFAAAGMMALNHFRSRFSVDALRVLGDVALIIPCLVFVLA